MSDCGGTVMASGNCFCERVACEACGTSYHADADQLRYCGDWGQICADNPDCRYACSGDCCYAGPDTREEERGEK